MNLRTGLALFLAIGLLAGCSRHYAHKRQTQGSKTSSPTVTQSSPSSKGSKNGPPPHAPAHGYRHKHQSGAELSYDKDTGVYVVIGYEAHYYEDGFFFRYQDEDWEVSVEIDKGWKVAAKKNLPSGLQELEPSNGKSKGKGKGKSKGKGNGQNDS